MHIPKSHPRHLSLTQRHKIEEGVRNGVTHGQGLIAQGRGEAFDYLLGERTNAPAKKAIRAAAALLLSAKNPILSVNGNVAALCPKEMVILSRAIPAKLEVNLFYRSEKRIAAIARVLKKCGAREVLTSSDARIVGLSSERRKVSARGIGSSDVVLIPLEDGDRAEKLMAEGKKTIAIDLNPLSRTAQKSTITIVDNIPRALPLLTSEVRRLKGASRKNLLRISKFDNKRNLAGSLRIISRRFGNSKT